MLKPTLIGYFHKQACPLSITAGLRLAMQGKSFFTFSLGELIAAVALGWKDTRFFLVLKAAANCAPRAGSLNNITKNTVSKTPMRK